MAGSATVAHPRVTEHWMGLGACDCPEAQLLRRLVALLDQPDGMLNELAATMAVWKLRHMSHDLSAAGDWSAAWMPWARRQEYATDPRTAAELHADVSASWEAWYRARSTEWLTECAEHASDTGPHGPLVRRILQERQ